MDARLNIANIAFSPCDQSANTLPQAVTRLYYVRAHRLHGIITGVEGVQIMASAEDGLDRLLVSFKDAKV